MADANDSALTKEEEDILLNQSESDNEYEDATDELPLPESLSERLQEQLDFSSKDDAAKSQGINPAIGVGDAGSRASTESDKKQEHACSLNDGDSSCDKDCTVSGGASNTNADPSISNVKTESDSFKSDTDSSDDDDDMVDAAMKDAEEPVNDAEEAAADKDFVDEELLKEKEDAMTEEEKEAKKGDGQALKALGNDLFRKQDYEPAIEAYTDALMACPLCFAKERSIMYSNRAACKYKLEKYESGITDCSKALELNPAYLKALLRRAELFEKTDKLDDALVDYQKVLEMDPSIHQARAACMRLPEEIKDRNEKMKEEMMGKLKDLGNMILKPFGLSTNNFQMQQDPNTGGYSVNFNQNTNNG